MHHTGANLGSVLNFNALLLFAQDAEYIMFCDQDDKWLPEKIADTLNCMLQSEAAHRECTTPYGVYRFFVCQMSN